jgi:hypothetical protein
MLSLKGVLDDELLRRLAQLAKQSRGVEAELVAHIGAVARAAREQPVLLEMLRDGRLHLSGIGRLAPHLTGDNAEAVLERASGMSHREIRELAAELEPRPDVAPSVRKLPERSAPVGGGPPQLGAPRVESPAVNVDLEPLARGDGARGTVTGAVHLPPRAPAPARPALVEPLSPSRYQVRFTASAELRDKLERLQALMRASVPDGDLARIIDIAVSEKLQRVEARRFGRTKAPRSDPADADTSPASRHIPAAVRRLVHERDGGRCAYRDEHGQRCARRHDLEFHHKRPFARGGDHSPANLTLMCRAHNTLLAEQDYGADVMARFRAAARRACVPVDACGARIVVQSRGVSSG